MDLIAHRARINGDPENAIESLREVASRMAGVEVDARLTSDGVPVLMHDRTVDRTTNGTGRVEAMTFAEVSALELIPGGQVPSLEAYLAACATFGPPTVLVDLKQKDDAALRGVAHHVMSSAASERCIVMTRSIEAMEGYRREAPDGRLGCLAVTRRNVDERLAAARRLGAELMLVRHGDDAYLRNRIVPVKVRAAGLRPGASTLRSRAALNAAREDGCELALVDHPET